MAVASVARKLRELGADPVERDFTTDNGNRILDLHGLEITDPEALEAQINQIPGVVTVGLFAKRGADVLLLAAPEVFRFSIAKWHATARALTQPAKNQRTDCTDLYSSPFCFECQYLKKKSITARVFLRLARDWERQAWRQHRRSTPRIA